MAQKTEDIDPIDEIEKAIKNAKPEERYVYVTLRFKEKNVKVTMDLTTGEMEVIDVDSGKPLIL